MTTELTSPSVRYRHRWVLWWFLGFFLVFSSVDGLMVWLATSTQRGVVTEDAYEKGLAYNRTIAAKEAQEALNWTSQLSHTPPHGLTQTLTLNLQNAERQALAGATASLHAVRPVQDGMDFHVPMSESLPGQYEAAVTFPLPGVWDVYLDVHSNGLSWQTHKRLFLQP